MESLEAQHRPRYSLDEPMILLNDIDRYGVLVVNADVHGNITSINVKL
ncbi:hypothetical protein U5922_015355 [Aquicoccus sp. G2-2]|nr:hypothetical protein [Aquicoccus sp. G2-2]MEA1114767.1 hypothetical protein [Aquicoccus sp. G2-2]